MPYVFSPGSGIGLSEGELLRRTERRKCRGASGFRKEDGASCRLLSAGRGDTPGRRKQREPALCNHGWGGRIGESSGSGACDKGEGRGGSRQMHQCQCTECIKGCVYLQHYKRNPRAAIREIYNNLSIVMGNHMANGLINACDECGQCRAACPNGFDYPDVCRSRGIPWWRREDASVGS